MSSFNLDIFTIETYEPVTSISQKGIFIHSNEQSYIKINDTDSDLKVENLESRDLLVINNIQANNLNILNDVDIKGYCYIDKDLYFTNDNSAIRIGPNFRIDDNDTSLLNPYFSINATTNITKFGTNDVSFINISASQTISGSELKVVNNADVVGWLKVGGNITGSNISGSIISGSELKIVNNADVVGWLKVGGNITGSNISASNTIIGKSLNMYNDNNNLIYLNTGGTHELKIKKEHILFSSSFVFNVFSSESKSERIYIRSYTGSSDYSSNTTSNYHDIINFYRTGSKNVVSIGSDSSIGNLINISTGSILFISGSIYPSSNDKFELGNKTPNNRWKAIYAANISTTDLILDNDIGSWRIVEGEEELYIYNAKKKKKYKFLLKEIEYDNYLEKLEN